MDAEYMFGVEPDEESQAITSGCNDHLDLFCCDFSMRRPGFAVLRFYTKSKKITV